MIKVLAIIKTLSLFTALGLVVVGLGSIIQPKYKEYNGLKRQRDALKEEINVLTEAVSELKELQYRFSTDPETATRTARRHKRIADGEYLFIFDHPDRDPESDK